jgi:hypothetical protein
LVFLCFFANGASSGTEIVSRHRSALSTPRGFVYRQLLVVTARLTLSLVCVLALAARPCTTGIGVCSSLHVKNNHVGGCMHHSDLGLQTRYEGWPSNGMSQPKWATCFLAFLLWGCPPHTLLRRATCIVQ